MGQVIDMAAYKRARIKEQVRRPLTGRKTYTDKLITRSTEIPRQKFDTAYFAKFLDVTDAESVLPRGKTKAVAEVVAKMLAEGRMVHVISPSMFNTEYLKNFMPTVEVYDEVPIILEDDHADPNLGS